MKKFFNYSLALATIALTLVSCQEEIDLDLPATEPELVIDGYFVDLDMYLPEGDLACPGTDTVFKLEDLTAIVDLLKAFPIDSIETTTDYFPFNKVILSTTSDYFSNAPAPVVSGAVVELFEDGLLVETLAEDPNIAGTYRITHDPIVGKEYHLEIEALGNEYETDPETYDRVAPLASVSTIYGPNFIGDSLAYYMNIGTFEEPGTPDYYRWMFYINNEYQNSPFELAITDDQGFDGFCLLGIDVFGDTLSLGDTLVVFQLKTSEAYNNFISTLQAQTGFVGSPFDAPPAPIKGNVRNITKGTDAYGFFSAGGISANFTIVPDTIPE
jgi:hypothetical protein